MKALWLGFSLLAMLGFSPAIAQQKKKVELSSQQRSDIEGSLKSIGQAYASEEGPEKRLKLGQHRPELMELAQDLYYAGFLSADHYKKFEKAIESQKELVLCESDKPSDCGPALAKFFRDFYEASIKGTEPYCKGIGEVASAGACCGELAKLPFLTFEASNSCKQESKQCSNHGECCSNFCEMEEGASAGTCAPVYSCYQLKQKGEECPPTSPYCAQPCDPSDPSCSERISCMDINYNSSGVGECKAQGATCSANTDCCSDKCSQGKCVPKSVCSDCAKMGETPRSGQACCPGSYKGLNGKCIQDFPPFTIPTVRHEPSAPGILKKLIGLILPSAHASEPQCVVGNDGLDNEQRAEYEKCLHEKTNKSEGEWSEDKMLAAVGQCDDIKKKYLAENKEKGCWERELSRNEYRDIYNMPAILSKTYSDVEKCEFNTHNDAWRSKSNLSRNAELALRAFEFTYSGKGHDMVVSGNPVEPGKKEYYGQSIFGRAQKVATELRKNRYDLVKSFLDIDIEMTCKCLAVFGPSKFSAEKQEFFKESCQAEQGYVTEEEIKDDRGDNVAKAGEVDATTETDKGAVGITHEKLLIEWLGLRRDVQFANFQNNEKLEQQLNDLSSFITNYNWMDTPTTTQKSHYLYTFHVIYLAGWIAIVLAIIAIVASFFIPGIGLLLQSLAGLVLAAGIFSLFNSSSHDPSIFDKKVGKGCWKKIGPLCIYKYDKYDRFLRWPFFDNHNIHSQLKKPDNHCKLNGHASQCIKSVFLVSHEYKSATVDIPIENHPMLDAALPLTVKSSSYKAEVTKDNKTYAKLLDESFWNSGLPGLKATASKYFKKKGDRWYIKQKHYTNEFKNKLLTEQEHLEKFLLGNGKWKPNDFVAHKKAYIDGAVKYALCKKLVDCAEHSKELLGSSEEERIKHIGFGYLFEEEEDARQFGEYAYQMHLLWPRLAAEKRIAYPTLGMDAYFQAMAYNLRLVGSLALKQSMDTTQLYDLYVADWEKRKGDYQGLGGADRGSGSKNAKLPEQFWADLKTLDFQSVASVEAFSAKVDGYKKTGQFDSVTIGAYDSVGNHAIRRSEARAKEEHYRKTYGSTARGKIKSSAASKFSKAFNSPLDKMKLSVGGQNLGAGSSSGSDTNTSEKALAKKNDANSFGIPSSAYGKGQGGLNPGVYTGAGFGTTGFDKGAYGEDEVSGTGGKRVLSESDTRMILDAAAKDESLEEILPGDSLWTVVSKAYKRNLSRVLVLKSDSVKEKEPEPAKEKITDGDKERLKDLLESN